MMDQYWVSINKLKLYLINKIFELQSIGISGLDVDQPAGIRLAIPLAKE